MHKTPKIVSLASALAALAAPAVSPPIADAADVNDGQVPKEVGSGVKAETVIRKMDDGELMSFTVHRISDGLMFPQHGSHSSHSSHASHASSSPGIGLPNIPDVPNPVYAPPVYAPPAAPAPIYGPATTPPLAVASDPKYVACTAASNGFGVNQIASQLEQIFGMAENDAVNMAQQALVAVVAGGHYCDGYLGNHE